MRERERERESVRERLSKPVREAEPVQKNAMLIKRFSY